MKIKRILALVCVSLTLVTMGVGVFAFQPPEQSPLVTYGAFQTDNFNSNLTCSVVADTCEVCGVTGYCYVISPPTDINAFYDGSFSIIDTTSLNRGFNGLYTLLDDHHSEVAHKINTAYVNGFSNGKAYVFTTRTLTVTDAVRYTALYVPLALTVESGLDNFINSDVVSVTAHTAYSYGLLSPYPLQDFMDDKRSEALAFAYNDGQINASENIGVMGIIDEIISGVAMSLNPILTFEFLGVSALSLIGLMCTLFVVLLIIKVVRS